jgi:hypothetical protein
MHDRIALQKFANCQIDAMIEATEDCGFGNVRIGAGIEVKDLPHYAIVSGEKHGRRLEALWIGLGSISGAEAPSI